MTILDNYKNSFDTGFDPGRSNGRSYVGRSCVVGGLMLGDLVL